MKAETKQILVIEDDTALAELLELHLRDVGAEVARAQDGQAGLELALAKPHDLIILDVMLPGLDGMEICRRLRMENRTDPILMLTSRSEELDKVLGLELGADDYMTKPFSIREFLARVKALFRRREMDQLSAREEPETNSLQVENLVIDPTKRRVQLADEIIELTAKEFDLLWLFASHPGRAYTRQQLLDQVWGYQYSGYDHTVNSHINRLRTKIEADPAKPRFIQTVWGVGYRFIDKSDLTS